MRETRLPGTPPELPLTVYTPESPLRHPAALVKGMLRDLAASRGLAWRLFVRDTSAPYRQSLLGYAWLFIPPLVVGLPFVFLNAQGVIAIGGTAIPYAAFALIGTTIWQSFVDALLSPVRTVSASRGMLLRVNFPREAILLAGIGQVRVCNAHTDAARRLRDALVRHQAAGHGMAFSAGRPRDHHGGLHGRRAARAGRRAVR